MTITTTLADADGGTEVCMSFEGIPPGVRPADKEPGHAWRWRSSRRCSRQDEPGAASVAQTRD
jgi:hypothetical protein